MQVFTEPTAGLNVIVPQVCLVLRIQVNVTMDDVIQTGMESTVKVNIIFSKIYGYSKVFSVSLFVCLFVFVFVFYFCLFFVCLFVFEMQATRFVTNLTKGGCFQLIIS